MHVLCVVYKVDIFLDVLFCLCYCVLCVVDAAKVFAHLRPYSMCESLCLKLHPVLLLSAQDFFVYTQTV